MVVENTQFQVSKCIFQAKCSFALDTLTFELSYHSTYISLKSIHIEQIPCSEDPVLVILMHDRKASWEGRKKSVEPLVPTGKILHRLLSLDVKTAQIYLGRLENLLQNDQRSDLTQTVLVQNKPPSKTALFGKSLLTSDFFQKSVSTA